MKGSLDKIETIFEALKLLDIKPTPNNVSILNGVYEMLRDMYNKEKEGVAGEGQTVDTEGQHNH